MRALESIYHLVRKLRRRQEHRHVDWQIRDDAFCLQCITVEDNCIRNTAVLVRNQVIQRMVAFVVLSALHLNGQNAATPLDDEIDFAVLCGIVVVGAVAVSRKLLRHEILEYRAKIDVRLSV